MSAIISCAFCTAPESSCTQPLSGSLTNLPEDEASRLRSASVRRMPSTSHSAETENQSMPLPFTINCGLSARGDMKRRLKPGLPR
jgi:hypothetical protein